MKKSHIMGVAAGTVLSTAFMLAGCEKQDLYLSEHGTYSLGTDRGTFVLEKSVKENDGFRETLTREVTVNFSGSASPSGKDVCVAQSYRVEGDIAFNYDSSLAQAYLQSAPNGLKAVIRRQYSDAENKGLLHDEKLLWKAPLECGEAISGDFPQALKDLRLLRASAQKTGFGL